MKNQQSIVFIGNIQPQLGEVTKFSLGRAAVGPKSILNIVLLKRIYAKMKIYRPTMRCVILAMGFSIVGCSNGGAPILPQGELTQEQLEKIKKEDRAIEQEESQGSIKN